MKAKIDFLKTDSVPAEPISTNETPLIVAEKRALEEELHTLKMSIYDRHETDTEIESFKQTIKQLEEKLEQMRNECQDLYKQKHEDAEEQIARKKIPLLINDSISTHRKSFNENSLFYFFFSS